MNKKKPASKSFAFVVTLGSREGVPRQLVDAPCYVVREDCGHLTTAIHELAETPVTKADAKTMVATLREFIESFDIARDLYSDAEEPDVESFDYRTAYFSGVSLEDARKALEQCGAIVEEIISLPEKFERGVAMQTLERHLEMTSLPRSLEAISGGDELPYHARELRIVIEYGLDTDPKNFRKALLEKLASATSEQKDVVTLLVAHGSRDKECDSRKALAALLAELPKPVDAGVKKQLEKWRLAVGRKTKAATKKPSAKPRLFLDAVGTSSLADFEGAGACVRDSFDLKGWPKKNAPEAKAAALAQRVAEALDGVVHSSDTDCAYMPVVLAGAKLEGSGLFDALGIGVEDRIDVAGYDNAKLSVDVGKKPSQAIQAFTRLDDDEIEKVDDYLRKDDQRALAKAAKLLGGAVVGVQLCADDHTSKIVLALGKVSPKLYAGVLAFRIET